MTYRERKELLHLSDPSSWKTSRIGRRSFLLGSLATGLSLVLIACGSDPKSTPLDLTELQKYPLKKYPAFNVSDYEAHLTADPSIKVDPDGYKQILQYITNLAKNGAVIPYLYSGKKINGKIRYNGVVNTRNFYLLTDNVPFPKHNALGSEEGFTKYDTAHQTSNSFVRVHSNQNIPGNPIKINSANTILFVESCQAIIQGGADTQADSDIFQEVFCNSLGQAIAMKVSNYSYRDYQGFYSQATFRSPDGKSNLPVLILPESEWNLIPNTGPVIN